MSKFEPSEGFARIGDNVYLRETPDGRLLIEIDMTVKGAPSASGKNIVLASTRGNTAIATRAASIGLNVYCKPGSK